MRSIEIPYGRGRQIFHIEDHRLTGVLMPETMPKAGEETETVRRAISAPIDSARLSTLSQTAERILLITSDHTRPVPSRITLPLLLEEIREGNSAPKPFELILKITKALRFFEKSQGFFAGAPGRSRTCGLQSRSCPNGVLTGFLIHCKSKQYIAFLTCIVLETTINQGE